MRIADFYWMKDDPDRVRTMGPQHAGYWRGLGLVGYLGGPFADRSGGLITFEAESLEAGERIITADPFVGEELLDSAVVKRRMPE
jgi:hypothetical protein